MVRHILRASKAWGLRLSEIISKHTRRDGGLRPFQVREEALLRSRGRSKYLDRTRTKCL
jgi:hypothetical protein